MAGVGRLAPKQTGTPSSTPRRIAPARVKDFYDLVVVGSGVSGMSAALSAAHHGLDVLLVDEYGFPGGHSFGYQPEPALREARDHLSERIGSHVAVQYLPHVTAQGFYPPDTLLLGPGGSAGFEVYTRRANEPSGATASGLRAGMRRVRARSFIFAAGANDIVPLFQNNDTPGIFGERAIRLLLERDALRPGTRAVVYGTGPALRVTGELLLHHDIELVALVDPTEVTKAPEHNRRALDKVRTITEARVRAAKGNEWLRGVEVSRDPGGERVSLSCDLLCIALPGQPAYELPYQAGVGYSLSYSSIQELRVMLPAVARVARGDDSASFFIVGEAAGESDWRKKIEDGTQAGADAARRAG
jgi:sarcosine oxidase subunit alpha